MEWPKILAKLISSSRIKKLALMAGLSVALFPLCLFLLGCSQLGNKPSPGNDNYFPLISGQVVTYEVTTNTPVGWTINNPLPPGANVTYETSITFETWAYHGETVILGSIEVFQINVTSNGSTTANYWQADANGVYSYGDETHIFYPPLVRIKYPLTTGTTWEWSSGLIAEVATEETVNAPAGAFTGKRINYSPGVFYKSFAKDIGLIFSYDGGFGLIGPITSREVYSKNF